MDNFYGTWYQSSKFPTRVANLRWSGSDLQAKVASMAQQFYSLKAVYSMYPNFPGTKACVCIAKQIVYKESTWNPNKINNYISKTSASVRGTSDRIVLSNHGLIDGSEIKLSSLTGTTGLINNTWYYVKNSTVGDFQVSSTPTGNPIDITGDGTCFINYTVYGLWQISNVHSRNMAQWPTKNGYPLSTIYSDEYNTRMAFTIMNSAINAGNNPWLSWSTYNNSDSDSAVKVCLSSTTISTTTQDGAWKAGR